MTLGLRARQERQGSRVPREKRETEEGEEQLDHRSLP